MTRKTNSSVFAFFVAAAILPACGGESGPIGQDLSSQDKPLPPSDQGCGGAPGHWTEEDDYPRDKLTIGTKVYDVPTLFAWDETSLPRKEDAIVVDVATVMLNVAAGAETPDEVLIATGELDNWLADIHEACEAADTPKPVHALAIVREYFRNPIICVNNFDELAEL
jgi:hypothetical protein